MLHDIQYLAAQEAAAEEAFNKKAAETAAAAGAVFKTLEDQAKAAIRHASGRTK